ATRAARAALLPAGGRRARFARFRRTSPPRGGPERAVPRARSHRRARVTQELEALARSLELSDVTTSRGSVEAFCDAGAVKLSASPSRLELSIEVGELAPGFRRSRNSGFVARNARGS